MTQKREKPLGMERYATPKIGAPAARVGVAGILRRGAPGDPGDGAILMGRRRGSHGAGTWSFTGGKLGYLEGIGICASRELHEETGLMLHPEAWVSFGYTNDVFPGGKNPLCTQCREVGVLPCVFCGARPEPLHYVTLYALARFGSRWGSPRVMEPDKLSEWRWFLEPPPYEELFLPVQNLLDSGMDPWAERERP